MLLVEGLAATTPAELRDRLDEVRETARRGIEEVRRIAATLRPEALEDLGLPCALVALANGFAEQTGVQVEHRLERGLRLPEDQELVIYRIAQEALTNVARHAGAGVVELRLERTSAQVTLRVRDDGRGLPADAASSSHGIRGMRERAMLIGASLSIGRAPAGGTEVRLAIPRMPGQG
jgi:two-component system sensor histidine kinase UhpB